MYAYFIDEEASIRHKRDLDRLDLVLTQRGITGRKIYLNRLSDLGKSVRECLAGGAKTIVSVGSDAAASRLINVLAKPVEEEFSGAVFGVLPVGSERAIAHALGYAEITQAVDALVRHHVERLDLGRLNDRHYFVGAAVFPRNVSLSFLSYRVSSLRRDHHISVCNMNMYAAADPLGMRAFNPTDGRLEAVIAFHPNASWWSRITRTKNTIERFVLESVFPIEKITVTSKQKTISVMADAEKKLSTPVLVEVAPKALAVIMGAAPRQ